MKIDRNFAETIFVINVKGEIMIVSVKFILAKQARFDKKNVEYYGINNPKNYKNMSYDQLIARIRDQQVEIDKAYANGEIERLKKELVDTSNLCELLWRRLKD